MQGGALPSLPSDTSPVRGTTSCSRLARAKSLSAAARPTFPRGSHTDQRCAAACPRVPVPRLSVIWPRAAASCQRRRRRVATPYAATKQTLSPRAGVWLVSLLGGLPRVFRPRPWPASPRPAAACGAGQPVTGAGALSAHCWAAMLPLAVVALAAAFAQPQQQPDLVARFDPASLLDGPGGRGARRPASRAGAGLLNGGPEFGSSSTRCAWRTTEGAPAAR
jgi:hypothetical protein